jgi:hypothetical protein
VGRLQDGLRGGARKSSERWPPRVKRGSFDAGMVAELSSPVAAELSKHQRGGSVGADNRHVATNVHVRSGVIKKNGYVRGAPVDGLTREIGN